ncbi:MAG: DUF883 family protein [Verrucomicrobiota bacterium]
MSDNHDSIMSETQTKLVSDVKEVIADAEALIKATADDIGEKAGKAREQLSKSVGDAKVKIQEVETVVREQTIAGAKETDKVIRQHPYESIGVAFGIGVLLGVLLNRK